MVNTCKQCNTYPDKLSQTSVKVRLLQELQDVSDYHATVVCQNKTLSFNQQKWVRGCHSGTETCLILTTKDSILLSHVQGAACKKPWHLCYIVEQCKCSVVGII